MPACSVHPRFHLCFGVIVCFLGKGSFLAEVFFWHIVAKKTTPGEILGGRFFCTTPGIAAFSHGSHHHSKDWLSTCASQRSSKIEQACCGHLDSCNSTCGQRRFRFTCHSHHNKTSVQCGCVESPTTPWPLVKPPRRVSAPLWLCRAASHTMYLCVIKYQPSAANGASAGRVAWFCLFLCLLVSFSILCSML